VWVDLPQAAVGALVARYLTDEPAAAPSTTVFDMA
jgi:hypothetical protein